MINQAPKKEDGGGTVILSVGALHRSLFLHTSAYTAEPALRKQKKRKRYGAVLNFILYLQQRSRPGVSGRQVLCASLPLDKGKEWRK